MTGTLEPTKLKICNIWPFMEKLYQLLFLLNSGDCLPLGGGKEKWMEWGVNDYILSFKLLMGYILLLIFSMLKVLHNFKRDQILSCTATKENSL